MAVVLFWTVVIGGVFFIMIFSGRKGKRGCGRGCATCGNRDMCYRKKKSNK